MTTTINIVIRRQGAQHHRPTYRTLRQVAVDLPWGDTGFHAAVMKYLTAQQPGFHLIGYARELTK